MSADSYAVLVTTVGGTELQAATFVSSTDGTARSVARTIYARGLDSVPWRLDCEPGDVIYVPSELARRIEEEVGR